MSASSTGWCKRLLVTALVGATLLFAFSRLRVSMPLSDGVVHPALPTTPVTPIYSGVTVTQEFPASERDISALQLLLATYGRRNAGTLTLHVDRKVRGRWERLATTRVEKDSLQDNRKHVFTFDPPLKVGVGQLVALKLTADGSLGNSVTWWSTPDLDLPGHRLLVNGQVVRGTAFFDVSYGGVSGMAGGPRMRGRIWKRLTVLLDVPGQIMLVGGFTIALFAFVHLLLWPPPDDAANPGVDCSSPRRIALRSVMSRFARLIRGSDSSRSAGKSSS